MCLTLKLNRPQPKIPFTLQDVEKTLAKLIVPKVAKKSLAVRKILHKNPKDPNLFTAEQYNKHVYEVGKTYTEKEFLVFDIKREAQRMFNNLADDMRRNQRH